LRRILWYTKTKSIDEAQVSIENIVDIAIGQNSENFLKYPLKMLEDCSFSIYYKKKDGKVHTLDLTCKDNREFDLWVIGIKTIYAHFNKKIISKDELLNHSKSYKEQVAKGNIGNCSKFLIYNSSDNKEDKKLDNFIISRKLTNFDFAKLCLSLCNRIKILRNDIETITLTDEYKTGFKEDGYDLIFAEEAIVDDLDTQKNLMINLFKESEETLAIISQQFLWFIKEYNLATEYNVFEEDMDDFMKTIYNLGVQLETHMPKSELVTDKINQEYFLKELDIKLWKIEIDLENVGDIINRFKNAGNIGFVDKLKNIFKIFK
jgi:hypothetical protein